MNADEWDALTPEGRRYLTTPDRSCVRCHHPVAPLGRAGEDDHYVLIEQPLRMSMSPSDSDAFVRNTYTLLAERDVALILCSELHRIPEPRPA